eukprot:c11744_g1_i1.p1 GENE.c11744_g1_i1~~c11744_g1_i1.p1  ORF type:complete len:116 (-),score=4.97 c11744_g1_i1:799-1146(-)
MFFLGVEYQQTTTINTKHNSSDESGQVAGLHRGSVTWTCGSRSSKSSLFQTYASFVEKNSPKHWNLGMFKGDLTPGRRGKDRKIQLGVGRTQNSLSAWFVCSHHDRGHSNNQKHI